MQSLSPEIGAGAPPLNIGVASDFKHIPGKGLWLLFQISFKRLTPSL
jgi:hypothetical protein